MSRERTPHNRCSRLGKPVRTFLRFARAPRINVGEKIVGFQPDCFASPEQQPLRSHGDSAEVTAAITNRFADHCELCRTKPLSQIRAQLVSPYSWCVRADIILLIGFPPWIEHGTGGRFF